MKPFFDIKTAVMLFIPIAAIILDILIVPSLVPTVTTDRVVNWMASFKKTEQAFMLTRHTIEEVVLQVDPFKLKKPIQVKQKKEVVIHKKRPVPEKTWHLSMVIIGPKKRLARINGIMVTEGSVVQGYTVREIGKGYVVLVRGKEIKKVYLKQGG